MITIQDIKRAFTVNLRDNIIINGNFISEDMVNSIVEKTIEYNETILNKKKNEVYLKAIAELFNEMERNGEVLISDRKETSNSVLFEWDKRDLDNIRKSQEEKFLVGQPNDYKISVMESYSGMKALNTAEEYLKFFAGKTVGFFKIEFDTNSILYSESVNKFLMKIGYINKDINLTKRVFEASVRNVNGYIFSRLYNKEESREYFKSKDDYLAVEMFNLITNSFDEYSEKRKLKIPLILERLAEEYLSKYEDPTKVDALDRALYKLQMRSYRYMGYMRGFIDRFSDMQKEYLLNKLYETTIAPINMVNIDLVEQMYNKKGAKIFGAKFIEDSSEPDTIKVELNALKEILLMLCVIKSNNIDRKKLENFGNSIIIDNSYNNVSIKFNKHQYPNLTEENIIPFITEAFNSLSEHEMNSSKISERFVEEFNKLYRENILFKTINNIEKINKNINKKKI